ncbi:MAG TPA: hypothetical protein VFV94_00765 [Polyangiaceae bacterium]|nr:hypothetical protein [Polyangiaceae bacterium]
MSFARAATRAAVTGSLGAALVLLRAAAAQAQSAPQACVPGQQFSCACPAGGFAIQRCNAAGTGLEPCQCAPSSPPPPPAPAAPASEPCPSNQLAPDGTCLVSPEGAAVAPPTPPPPPPPPVVVNPPPPGAPAKDQGPVQGGGPNTAMMAGGISLFAVGYGATIGLNYGVCANSSSWRGCDSKELSFIPIAGSFILGVTENTELSYRLIAFTLGLAQAGGAVLFGLSFAGSGDGSQAKATYVLPTVSRSGAGAVVGGRF